VIAAYYGRALRDKRGLRVNEWLALHCGRMELTIKPPKTFNFHRTVRSHGWYGLLPFELDKAKWKLVRVLDREQRKPMTVEITSRKNSLRIMTSRAVSERAARNIIRDVRHMFRLDDDLQLFYEAMSADTAFAWISEQGAGRLLRSPTVYEDLVKMNCTTNCSWALTEKMVTALVNELGTKSDDDRKSFPTAEVMAERSVAFYRDKIRSGYRAPYLKELADRVASGELNVESWLTNDAPLADLMKEMKSVKGVGNYAAENLLKLIGRYDGLALDSWTRAQLRESATTVAPLMIRKSVAITRVSIHGAGWPCGVLKRA